VDEIISQVRGYGTHPVLVTGGEPLMHKEIHDLIHLLLEEGRTVLLETSGSLPVEALDPRVIKVLDIKCPGSGEADKTCWSNMNFLNKQDEVKFVICHQEDYRFACEVGRLYRLTDKCKVLFSAAQGFLQPCELAAWILRDHLSVRLQIQLHKFLWPGKPRGV